jgi:hypothetical protein
MRALVKMHLALRAYSYSDLCEILINPATGEPISTDTFARCFKREIKIAKMDIDGIAMGGFVRQLRKGNMTAFALHAKTQWGWSERPIVIALPKIETTADTVKAMSFAMEEMAAGRITPSQFTELSAGIGEMRKAIELTELADIRREMRDMAQQIQNVKAGRSP